MEMFSTLLAEGMTITSELHSVPIETYSAHPFTVAGTMQSADNANASDQVKAIQNVAPSSGSMAVDFSTVVPEPQDRERLAPHASDQHQVIGPADPAGPGDGDRRREGRLL
jgi:hypothetical protein